MDDDRLLNELRRYWDEIARGGPATPGDLNPELAAAIRRLHALPDVPPPDPVYARQLREGLMHATTISLAHPDPLSSLASNGRTAPGRRPLQPALPVAAARWAPAQLATALLVLLVLIGSLLIVGRGRSGPEPENPAIIPAIFATPATPATVSEPAVEFLWQSQGTPHHPFVKLGLPTVDPAGNVWVPEASLGQYLIFAPDGTFLEAWGAPGHGEGEFAFMCAGVPYGGIAFDETGAFYVADSGNFRIQKFGPDRTFLRSWGSFGSADDQFACPAALALDAQGRIYVADQSGVKSGGKIVVIDGDGAWLATWTGLRAPSGIAIDGDGNAWVADWEDGRVVKYSPDGVVLTTWDGSETADRTLQVPNNVAVDAEGRVFITEHNGNRVQVFAPDGSLLGGWGERGTGPGEFQEPRGIALDGQGRAYVTEWAGNRVQAFRLLPPVAPAATPAP